MRISEQPIVVVLWTQEGCDHCEHVVPIWRPIAERYQACLPSIRVDAAAHEWSANAYRIRATPTLMVVRWGRASYRRLEGEADAAAIEEFYQYAVTGMDCAL